MKVAVLGATGMLGDRTARALVERGHAVVVPNSELSRLSGVPHEARVVYIE